MESSSGCTYRPNDSTAPGGDRLRAMEQLESRALGKPKESVATEAAEPDEVAAMRAMTPEEQRILLRLMNEAEAEAARGAPEAGG
jgi:hypothetical protein